MLKSAARRLRHPFRGLVRRYARFERTLTKRPRHVFEARRSLSMWSEFKEKLMDIAERDKDLKKTVSDTFEEKQSEEEEKKEEEEKEEETLEFDTVGDLFAKSMWRRALESEENREFLESLEPELSKEKEIIAKMYEDIQTEDKILARWRKRMDFFLYETSNDTRAVAALDIKDQIRGEVERKKHADFWNSLRRARAERLTWKQRKWLFDNVIRRVPAIDALEQIPQKLVDEALKQVRPGKMGQKTGWYLPAETIVECFGPIKEAIQLDDQDILHTIEQSQRYDDGRLSWEESLNRVHMKVMNDLAARVVTECVEVAEHPGKIAPADFVKILGKHLVGGDIRGMNRNNMRLFKRFLQWSYNEEHFFEGFDPELFFKELLKIHMERLPTPEIFTVQDQGSFVSDSLDSVAERVRDVALVQAEQLAKTGADAAERAAQTGFGSALARELQYMEEYSDKLAGRTPEQKAKELERMRRIGQGSESFNREAYMNAMLAEKEAEEKKKEEMEAMAEAEETEGAAEDKTGEQKQGEEAFVAEEEGEDLSEQTPGTTALMTREEVKTVWEKRLERWGDRVTNWKSYRQMKNTAAQVAQSNNPVVAKAREKVQEAKDAVEDAKELWETSQHPLIWKARDVSDSLFGETEQGFVVGEIKKIDAGFDEQEFGKEMKTFMIPIVLEAFMSGDLDFLRTISSGQAEAALHAAITQRKTLGEVYDSRLIRISFFDVQKYALDNGVPTITIMFVGQHQFCVRNAKGDLVSGQPSDLENIQYAWNVTRSTTNPNFDWEITYFGMQFTSLLE